MISIYSAITSFTKIQNIDFIYDFCDFSDDVVITTDDDHVYKKLSHINNKIKILKTNNIDNKNMCYVSNLLNNSLQHTIYPIKVCLNIYEKILPEQKNIWYDMADLLAKDVVPAYAIPLLCLEDKKYIYIKSKWYIHKENLIRGNAAINVNDQGISSDCLDLIDQNGCIPPFRSLPVDVKELSNMKLPFVVQNAKS